MDFARRLTGVSIFFFFAAITVLPGDQPSEESGHEAQVLMLRICRFHEDLGNPKRERATLKTGFCLAHASGFLRAQHQSAQVSGSTEMLLLGKSEGQGPFDGSLVVRKDGTFSQYSVGPVSKNWDRKWKLTWSSQRPVLELQITSYEPEDDLTLRRSIK